MIRFRTTIILCLMALLTVIGYSQEPIKEIPVHFERGTSSSVISGSVEGYETIDYTLGAKGGQTMSVAMKTNHTANYFNVLPPNSPTAIFTGQIDGYEWTGVLPENGTYKIRVYLMRSAARRNEKAQFSLEVSITGTGSSGQDAKVAGTPFNATGMIPCSVGPDAKRSAQCEFGVIRHGQDNAEVHTSTPGGTKRILIFQGNEVRAKDTSLSVTSSKAGDEWEISINDFEFFNIPEAVINGG